MSHSLPTGHELDLLVVMEELADVKVKWYNIGLGLGLDYGTLDAIKEQYQNSHSDCLRDTLKMWLKADLSATQWTKVVKALRTKTVGERKLARDLEQKYCTAQDTTNETAARFVLNTSPHHQAQGTTTSVATPLPLSTISNNPPNHPALDTSTSVATPLPLSTISTTSSHHSAQDTSTIAMTLSSQSTMPPYHPAQHAGRSPFTLPIMSFAMHAQM